MQSLWPTRFAPAAPDYRQAVRAVVGSVVAFALYKALGLPQGFWAVFTVILITQGSVGSTLAAARDRLVGTVIGAVIGGGAALLVPTGPLSTALALCMVVGLTVAAASSWPQLRAAPITGAIMLLNHPASLPASEFAWTRVVEITIGGAVGILVSVLIWPERSDAIFGRRVAGVLRQIGDLLRVQADQLDRNEGLPISPTHLAIRKMLAGVEQGLTDAERERAALLHGRPLPTALPRTLWRIRNDLVQISRALEAPLEDPVGSVLNPAAAQSFRKLAERADRYAAALDARQAAPALTDDDHPESVTDLVATVRSTLHEADWNDQAAARVFGFAFALQQLGVDMDLLGDQITEFSAGGDVSE